MGHRSEDAGAFRVFVVIDDDGGVVVETDRVSGFTTHGGFGADHNGLHHVGLFDAHVGIATVGAEDANALDALGAAVVGNGEIGLLLDYCFTSSASAFGLWLSTSAMAHRFWRLIGRVSVMRTRS